MVVVVVVVGERGVREEKELHHTNVLLSLCLLYSLSLSSNLCHHHHFLLGALHCRASLYLLSVYLLESLSSFIFSLRLTFLSSSSSSSSTHSTSSLYFHYCLCFLASFLALSLCLFVVSFYLHQFVFLSFISYFVVLFFFFLFFFIN